mmetsp:Transcript_18800/g.18916  ORF Transcript_18800/g.18916 Transcript_18800/m.18916 type:complete len:404 (+) Transcript_18800:38-1249(+)
MKDTIIKDLATEKLIDASKSGCIENIKVLIDDGADVNVVNRAGLSPLVVAVRRGHLNIVNALLELGADSNIHDIGKRVGTPLIQAIRQRIPKLVRRLLQAGAHVDLSNYCGQTALMEAVDCEDPSLVMILLSAGATVNLQDQNGRTALFKASTNVSITRLLVDAKANLNIQDKEGRTALIESSFRGNVDVVKCLLHSVEEGEEADVDIRDNDGKTALMNACVSYIGSAAVVKTLLEAGANVDAQDTLGETSLMMAIERKHEDIIRLLLDAGASIDIQDNICCKTALMTACELRCLNFVKLLLKHGANLLIKDNTGRTAMHYAFLNKNCDETFIPLIKILIQSDPNIFQLNNTRSLPWKLVSKEMKNQIFNIWIKWWVIYHSNIDLQQLREHGFDAWRHCVEFL